MRVVEFYGTKGEYGCFSNFSRHSVVIKNKRYKTSEHYYQSQKFATTDPLYSNKIAKALRPNDAAKLGRDKSRKLFRKDWESVKLDVMRVAIRAKAEQHPDIKALLLSTGDREIEETSKNDLYWGTGANGKGQNWLGRLWMELRTKFRAEANRSKDPKEETDEEVLEDLFSDFPEQR